MIRSVIARAWPGILPVLAGLAAPAAAWDQATAEHATFAPLWYRVGASSDGHECHAMGLLNLPPARSGGDAAAVVVTARGLRDARRDMLVAALLHEGAAVLEIVAGAVARCGVAEEASLPAAPSDVLAELRAARHALAEHGAGLIVAIGYGAQGEPALDAAALERAGGSPGGRLVAAASITDGTVRVARGAPAAEAEGWSHRAPRFCAALAAALPGGAEATRCATVLQATEAGTPVAIQAAGRP